MSLAERLVEAIRVHEGMDDQGRQEWYVGIDFDEAHGIFDRCNDQKHAEGACRALKKAAERFAED